MILVPPGWVQRTLAEVGVARVLRGCTSRRGGNREGSVDYCGIRSGKFYPGAIKTEVN
jgi:hypothetical protein